MNLKEIRKLFVEHSGRYDLVKDVTDYEDNGADFFINQGQKVLDRKSESEKMHAIKEYSVKAGESLLKIDDCRVIDEVYLVDSDEEFKYLEEIDYADFKEQYGGTEEADIPLYYTDVDLRSARPNKGDIVYSGILIAPKPKTSYMIYVRGKFYSASLKEDDDYSFWSMEHPMTLVQAALYSLERFYRNTSGMRDHMEAIMTDINDINFDRYESEASQFRVMRDSFNESDYKLKHKRG